MTRRRTVSAVFSISLLVAAACAGEETQPGDGGQPGGGERASVTMLIDFFPSGNHSPFYSAEAEGFFEEQNLDVSIEHVIGGTEVIKTIVAGQAEFGYADFASMAVANQNEDAGLIAVMGILQQSPMSILSPASNGIESPEDLTGKQIVDFAGSSTQVVWPVFLEKNGLAEGDINLELVDPATRLTLVVQGRADASVGFFTDNEPQLREQCDCDVNVVKWKDFGISSLSNGIVVSREFMEENPDVIERFVTAVTEGLTFTRDNPEAAVDNLIELKGEDLGVPRDVTLAQTLNELTLTTSPNGGGDPPGFMSEEDWQSTIDLMVQAGQMEAPEDIAVFYTNEFVPGA
jgi:NitT/TauT family transport system substrate-binding protein